ncbi:MAG: aspartate/glutamate racemase family protein [Proteobacteria bacterium]|nr:aspartate/glutamate racemase family protein [Pseudomonadota bacterium]
MTKAVGGKNIFGHSIGILMLESRFPRIPGDVGNATTWDFPVLYKVVKNATPDAVVRKGDRGLLPSFVKGAQELEKEGVRAITTSCGFLALFQDEMAAAVNVPVFTSSLMQVPLVYAMLKPSQKVGIITIHAKSLTQRHLSSVGADKVPHVILGTEGEEEFSRVIIDDEMKLDVEKSRDELVRIARKMVSDFPEVGAIVLECTNMPPYGAAIQQEIKLPVFDIYTFVNMVHGAVVRKEFSGYM